MSNIDDQVPDDISRQEYREQLEFNRDNEAAIRNGVGPLDSTTVEDDDLTTGPGFLARSRKAVVAAVAGLAVPLTALIPTQVADGVYTVEEFWFAFTVGVGGAVVGFLGVWYTPNQER